MMNSWIKRLTASLSAVALVGGMTFLAGCDDCDTCDSGCDTCQGVALEPNVAPYDTAVGNETAVRSEAAPVNAYREEIPASDIERREYNSNISVRDRSLPEPEGTFRNDLNRDYGATGAAGAEEGVRNDINVNMAPNRELENPGPNERPSAQRDIHNEVNVNAQPPAENTFRNDLEQHNAQPRTPASQSELQSQSRFEQNNPPSAQASQPSASARTNQPAASEQAPASQPSASASAQASQPSASASTQTNQPSASASAQANQPAASEQAPAASRETVPASSMQSAPATQPSANGSAVQEPATSQPSASANANGTESSRSNSSMENNAQNSMPASTPEKANEEKNP